MRFLILFIFIGFWACGQKTENDKISNDRRKKELFDSSIVLARNGNYQQAIALLDQATAIDSNYIAAYGNKVIFQLELKDFDKALITANNLIRINPE